MNVLVEGNKIKQISSRPVQLGTGTERVGGVLTVCGSRPDDGLWQWGS